MRKTWAGRLVARVLRQPPVVRDGFPDRYPLRLTARNGLGTRITITLDDDRGFEDLQRFRVIDCSSCGDPMPVLYAYESGVLINDILLNRVAPLTDPPLHRLLLRHT